MKKEERDNIQKLERSILQQELVHLGFEQVGELTKIHTKAVLTRKALTDASYQADHDCSGFADEDHSIVLCAKCCTTVVHTVAFEPATGHLLLNCGLCGKSTAVIKVAED